MCFFNQYTTILNIISKQKNHPTQKWCFKVAFVTISIKKKYVKKSVGESI